MKHIIKSNATLSDRKLINNTPILFDSVHPDPFLSFQIMARAEPADMVMSTILCLLDIKAPLDEIIIVDNNHSDATLYEPLKQFCDGLDNEFNVHFYHEDCIVGYKAGALNFALNHVDKRCDYVVVVDSDYQALPHARERIVSAIRRYPEHALLQFPQYYRDKDKHDVHSELNHYFSYHLRHHFNQSYALSTGTFAVIKKSALLRMGGWSGESITEDAHLGVLMHQAGERTRFIPEVIATGILPQTLADLIGQRRRWIYGNMQVMLRYFRCKPAITIKTDTNSTTSSNKFGMVRAHLSQLSAWVNFTGVFIALQAMAVLLLLMIGMINITSLAGVDLTRFALNGLAISFSAYGVYLSRRLIAYLKDMTPLSQAIDKKYGEPRTVNKVSISQRVKAFLVHICFWELGALSWLPVLWGQDKPFVSTPKLTATTSTFKNIISSVMVVPKFLIGLNVVTAILVTTLSPVLFWCAMGVVGIKLLASTVIIRNYVARPDDNHMNPLVISSVNTNRMSCAESKKSSEAA